MKFYVILLLHQLLRSADEVHGSFLRNKLPAEKHAKAVTGDVPLTSDRGSAVSQRVCLLLEPLILDRVRRSVQLITSNTELLVQAPIGSTDVKKLVYSSKQLLKHDPSGEFF